MAHFQDPCRAYAARRVISLVDATDLADDSSTETVKSVCSLALDCPRAAAVCVWPRFVKFVKTELPLHLPGVARLPVATVLNFPGGKGTLYSVKAEATQAVADGADELDLVVDWELLNRDPEDGEQALRRLVAGVREVLLCREVAVLQQRVYSVVTAGSVAAGAKLPSLCRARSVIRLDFSQGGGALLTRGSDRLVGPLGVFQALHPAAGLPSVG